jgi:hypothetical protein
VPLNRSYWIRRLDNPNHHPKKDRTIQQGEAFEWIPLLTVGLKLSNP